MKFKICAALAFFSLTSSAFSQYRDGVYFYHKDHYHVLINQNSVDDGGLFSETIETTLGIDGKEALNDYFARGVCYIGSKVNAFNLLTYWTNSDFPVAYSYHQLRDLVMAYYKYADADYGFEQNEPAAYIQPCSN